MAVLWRSSLWYHTQRVSLFTLHNTLRQNMTTTYNTDPLLLSSLISHLSAIILIHHRTLHVYASSLQFSLTLFSGCFDAEYYYPFYLYLHHSPNYTLACRPPPPYQHVSLQGLISGHKRWAHIQNSTSRDGLVARGMA